MTDDLDSKGFCILTNVFTPDELIELKKKFEECEADVHQTCKNFPPDPYDYVQLFEKETIVKMRSWCDDSIIETAKGRYDVTTQKVKDEFGSVPDTPAISNLMKSRLQTRYICDIGILVTNSHGNGGPWHRDTYNLNGPF